MGQQQRARTNPGGGGGGLASGVAAANDNDIVLVAHSPLSAIEAPPLAMAQQHPFRQGACKAMMGRTGSFVR
jgi:hypothetical protein